MAYYKVIERAYLNDRLHEIGEVVTLEEKLDECPEHLELINDEAESTGDGELTRGQKAALTRKRNAELKAAEQVEVDAAQHTEDPSLSGPVDL